MKKPYIIKNNKVFCKTSKRNVHHLENLPLSTETLRDLLNEAFQYGYEKSEADMRVKAKALMERFGI